MADFELSMELHEDYADIRDGVRKLCEQFPGEYWRNLEDQPPEGSYPTTFINTLTKAGYLAALIPEEFGGAGLSVRGAAVILETINATGCCASPGHAQMYTMGTILRHGSNEQKQKYLPAIAPASLRRDRANNGLGHHPTQDSRRAQGQWLRGQRPEGMDFPGAALGFDAAARAHHTRQ